MIRLAILGSGSSGNSAIVECGGQRLLIDAGLSAKQLALRLGQLGVEPASVNAVLLTHEHGDHIRGLEVFLRKHPVAIHTTAHTAEVVRQSGVKAHWKTFEAGQTFCLGEVEIRSFAIQHDAVDPVGFVITHDTRHLGFVSDAGFVTRSMTEAMRGLHGLFIEANYDERLLEADTKRPWATKQRIGSRHGHLSNRQVGELLREIAHTGLRHVILGHLSSDCNQPDLALGHIRQSLTEAGQSHVAVACAHADRPSGWFEV